jgi:hypothetical protein
MIFGDISKKMRTLVTSWGALQWNQGLPDFGHGEKQRCQEGYPSGMPGLESHGPLP